MPTCQNCGYKWTWRETFIKMFTFRNKLKWSSCGEFQYISKQSRNKLSTFTIVPFLIWIPLVSFSIPFQYVLTVELVSFVAVFICIPGFYKLSSEEEPLW
ncbi:TIGR04104 family putative zinc finger protein [Priestia endophytica]|uniref:TIGR04104 family putative zinc finger protein n=1 Tax=Priestia endophytica TaxID=135735 RepID=UPI00399CCB6B